MAQAQKPMEFTVWCLFSVDNEYDQPNNNLVCVWAHKPSMEQIAKTLNLAFPGHTDDQTLFVVKIWQGDAHQQQSIGDTSYRLEEVDLGVKLDG